MIIYLEMMRLIRSYYTATSGVLTENKNLSVLSNNIANANTSGFKREVPLNNVFEEMRLNRIAAYDRAEIGDGAFMNIAEASYTDHTPGSFEQTGRTLDFAIQGDGYFTVLRNDGTTYLTRNGECYLDDQGFLNHVRGGSMLDDTGAPIYLGTDQFEVGSQGELYVDGEYIASLGIVGTQDNAALTKMDYGFFAEPDDMAAASNFKVASQYVERSNVEMSKEMSQAMVSNRHFQACSQVMKMLDELTRKTVNDLGSVQ